MKTYIGARGHDWCTVVLVHSDVGKSKPLAPRLDLINHAPFDFQWGHGGARAAQLALALLADALGDDAEAVRLHQAFKWRVIAPLGRDAWSLTDGEIRDYVRELNEDRLRA